MHILKLLPCGVQQWLRMPGNFTTLLGHSDQLLQHLAICIQQNQSYAHDMALLAVLVAHSGLNFVTLNGTHLFVILTGTL